MVEYAVLWTDTARGDLEAIIYYIAEDSLQNALTILDRLETKASTLATDPRRGRTVPELRSLDSRRCRNRRFSGVDCTGSA
ncbi:type II toxin-antitoxin system RelE/ParE family toxin [Candidatus Thiosymbion oneisti]|uniref:type II toxin-antitoxin system RelE/ParE family toxin n=1 Tax=Candidatus Thiosymbion oneisti TaxID=589554 RepID=UPI000B7CF4BD|nr:type II toxin-antitoxin system RelE/ParE family toxin [Candidatus Thiosymbion oneisti]